MWKGCYGDMTGYGSVDTERKGEEPANDESGRSSFARDRDRILYTSAFRALAGKTQIVSAQELGRFHTRLTHSLRVAQLGRSLASRLGRADGNGLPDPDIVEAACLAHDIGHPPFGHAGEKELCEAMDKKGESGGENRQSNDGFEGNAQTFRIVTRIATKGSQKRPENGLNLTRATLQEIVKYPWRRGNYLEPKYENKWSAYLDDIDYFDWVLGDHREAEPTTRPLEEEIMDWSDDVAYACHDMEDFYRSGAIPLDKLLGAPSKDSLEQGKFLDWLEDGERWNRNELGSYDRSGVVAALHDLEKFVIVDAPYDGSPEMEAKVKFSTSGLISHFMNNIDATGVARFGYEATLDVPEELRYECGILKLFAWCYVITDRRLKIQQTGQRRIVRDLLNWHVEQQDLVPDYLREDVAPARAACDHVASLSERRAFELHRRLSGEHIGNITDMV